ncbi:response regulator transcription factor [Neolewinella lacunae]|uniref:Response regulator transcription factor n=1 Tax=Neolewinella lacunae TaxID=1517758 RepID=A0A923PFQ3_9BACT|nr:response regulator transcription factor [Neolewinella lacunae]MBC6993293.1 response regulator transcription factor [Neolewinella lacunae]MDN3633155.1 response regulator transcription factor [Neolewinella lacunae]
MEWSVLYRFVLRDFPGRYADAILGRQGSGSSCSWILDLELPGSNLLRQGSWLGLVFTGNQFCWLLTTLESFVAYRFYVLNTTTLKVIIADDHPLLLNGLEHCLSDAGYRIIAAVTNGIEALAAMAKHQPCLAVLDISMPGMNGLEAARQARARGLEARILLLSQYKNLSYIARAKSIPVDGYLLKENAVQDIVRALRTIEQGKSFFDGDLEIIYRLEVAPLLRKLENLSPAERRILLCIARGEDTKAIAEGVGISRRTVEKHRENIRRKLDLDLPDGQALNRWAGEQLDLLEWG